MVRLPCLGRAGYLSRGTKVLKHKSRCFICSSGCRYWHDPAYLISLRGLLGWGVLCLSFRAPAPRLSLFWAKYLLKTSRECARCLAPSILSIECCRIWMYGEGGESQDLKQTIILSQLYYQWRWVRSIPGYFPILACFGFFLSSKKATSGKPRGPDSAKCALHLLKSLLIPQHTDAGCREESDGPSRSPQQTWCFLQGQLTSSQIRALACSCMIGVQVCVCPSSLFLITLVA